MAYKGILGAVFGDIIGSRFEWVNYKAKDFELFNEKCFFTDDSVMTLAVGQALKECYGDYADLSKEAIKSMQQIGKQYFDCDYGGSFRLWLNSPYPEPYSSWGNGAAMRVSACAYFATSLDEAKDLSYKVTAVTHNHKEGLKGAEATTVATYMALHGSTKDEIREYITNNYYALDFTLDDIRADYVYDVSCQGSVPQALEAFFESKDYEDAIRNAVSIGGDSDTIAAITGAVACAYYGIPEDIKEEVSKALDETLLNLAADIDKVIAKVKPSDKKQDLVIKKPETPIKKNNEKTYKGILGAIFGDIIGSRFEGHNYRAKDFELFGKYCRFTDDTALTIAVGKALLDCNGDYSNLSQKATESLKQMGTWYPFAGYGGGFKRWLYAEKQEPYNSWGNGAAMRVSACAYFAKSLEEAAFLSHEVTAVTHNHPEGIKGAEATTVATYMALHGSTKDEIREHILNNYYNIDFELDDIRDHYYFDVSCQGSVPQALQAFFEARDYEDTIRNAISIGGDSDTIAAIAGAVAGAYYGVPEEIKEKSVDFLTYRLQTIVDEIDNKIQEIQNGL